MMQILTICRRALVLPLVVATAGCVGGLGTLGTLGTLGSIAELLGTTGRTGETPQQVQLTAEVRQVDTRRQLIQVETADGRAGGVMYDLGTTVVHEQQPYPINSLQPGDEVSLVLERAAQNNLYASRIEVVRLAEEDPVADTVAVDTVVRAPDAAPALRQLEGEVLQIDTERGSFRLHTQAGDTVTITLPFNPPAPVAERFNQLRSGDTVRVEGYPLGSSRLEIRRFMEAAAGQGPGVPDPAK